MLRAQRNVFGVIIFVFLLGFPIYLSMKSTDVLNHSDAKTIVLLAEDSRFNLNNPDILLKPGEVVQVVVRNNDSGKIKHNLIIPGLGVNTEVVEAGQSSTAIFETPNEGSFPYYCSIHYIEMNGKLKVVQKKY